MIENYIQYGGLAASLIMPLFNISLVRHVMKRKSSDDISLTWVVGVWGCIVVMFPAAITSPDPVFKVFGIVNLVLFSAVLVVVLKYRKA